MSGKDNFFSRPRPAITPRPDKPTPPATNTHGKNQKQLPPQTSAVQTQVLSSATSIRSSIPPQSSRNPPPRVPTKSEQLRAAEKRHAALKLAVPIVREAHGGLCKMEDALLQTLRTLDPYAHCKRLGSIQDSISDFKAWSNLVQNGNNMDTKRAEFIVHMICTLAKPIATALDNLDPALTDFVEFTQTIPPSTESSEADLQTHMTCYFHTAEKMMTVIGVLVGGLVEQPQGVLSPLQDQLAADIHLLNTTIRDDQAFENLSSKARNMYAEKLFSLAATNSTEEVSADTRCLRMQQSLAEKLDGVKMIKW
ncbi:hypothetical protein P171DRAFT_526219 [Karstenula rhodostoma CBS 690.94]|uniref:Uncharacterized protein n=1 Tax=Karstenula rhodostoma CBS 690.94 TaxID=1392251 RepID=A0A9P4P6V2_9PLEO|nr:hypothetical protein P171DRAFT_526219 [Karstenula rhodostoma CBS 690.94]